MFSELKKKSNSRVAKAMEVGGCNFHLSESRMCDSINATSFMSNSPLLRSLKIPSSPSLHGCKSLTAKCNVVVAASLKVDRSHWQMAKKRSNRDNDNTTTSLSIRK